jgi:hypothetical protein
MVIIVLVMAVLLGVVIGFGLGNAYGNGSEIYYGPLPPWTGPEPCPRCGAQSKPEGT